MHSYESELKVAIGASTVGKYICRASVKGFREVTASAEIFMKGPPRIFKKDPIQVTASGSFSDYTDELY